MKIEIETHCDHHECDTCGNNWAEGGTVLVDGQEVVTRTASAHCQGSDHFSAADLLVIALAKLGHKVTIDGEPYPISMRDEDYEAMVEALAAGDTPNKQTPDQSSS